MIPPHDLPSEEPGGQRRTAESWLPLEKSHQDNRPARGHHCGNEKLPLQGPANRGLQSKYTVLSVFTWYFVCPLKVKINIRKSGLKDDVSWHRTII